MFARLLRFQTKIDWIDEASKLFKEGVIPLCKNQKGYKSYFVDNSMDVEIQQKSALRIFILLKTNQPLAYLIMLPRVIVKLS